MKLRFSTKIKYSLSAKNPLMKKVVAAAADAKNRRRYKKFSGEPVNKKMVLFMSFMGKKYADSPRVIYEYMLREPRFKDYEFVWTFVQPDNYSFLEQNPRTRVLRYHSDEHYRVYATAGYWITNSRVPLIIPVRDEQVYLQCWHGTPLKGLGLDVKVSGNNARYTQDEMNSMYTKDADKYTFMVSPSGFCSEKFSSAFGLDRSNREHVILEQGYPRNDELIGRSDEDIDRIKEALGIPANKKVVLYAPTWRDNQHAENIGYTYDETVDFHRLRERIGDEYVILFRAHYFISSRFDFSKHEGFVYNVSDMDDINDLYLASDILVTDYSSVFFDYANLKRPMIFYMYDLAEYRDEMRGFYFSFDELPGPIVMSQKEMADAIIEAAEIEEDEGVYKNIPPKYRERYEAFNKKYNPLDDGKATERIVNSVIK